MTDKNLPTGEGTADEHEVADPHPATEEDYDKIPHPGGVRPAKGKKADVNSYAHDGNKLVRKDNKA